MLNAEKSYDPDGDSLTFHWFLYHEPGSYLLEGEMMTERYRCFTLNINDRDKPNASFTAPTVSEPKDMHLILEVTDSGSPRLTRYQRVIVTVMP